MLVNIPATSVLAPTVSHSGPHLPRRPARPAGRSDSGSCGVTAFAGSQCASNFVGLPRAESVPPSPVELLHSSQMLWGLLPPMPDPQAGSLTWAQTSLLWENLSRCGI